MDKIKKIFVVINPTTNYQYALERASTIAKRRKSEIMVVKQPTSGSICDHS